MGQKPFALWVIAGGLVYMAIALLYLGLPFVLAGGLTGSTGSLIAFLLVFVVVFLIAAGFTLREKRWAYVLAAASSTVLLGLFGSFIIESLKNPADSGFWLSVSGIPALLLVILFSVLSFINARTGLAQKRYLATPSSAGGLLTVAFVGFVIGALVAGAIGAGVILRNVTAGTGDVQIVLGAPGAAMAFVPQTFTVAVGGKVMWINKDTTTHTITSNDTSPGKGLTSPLISTGETWSYTFTAPGRYEYHCNPHPQMWGVVVVS